jgi:hypothetical protein
MVAGAGRPATVRVLVPVPVPSRKPRRTTSPAAAVDSRTPGVRAAMLAAPTDDGATVLHTAAEVQSQRILECCTASDRQFRTPRCTQQRPVGRTAGSCHNAAAPKSGKVVVDWHAGEATAVSSSPTAGLRYVLIEA